jgi:SAM-dependent methyltransferase
MPPIERWLSYDAEAESYNLGRPGYPKPVIDECVRLANLGPESRILEIGCGSGQATRSFATRGFRITCLEPGANLARLARKNLSAFPRVEILEVKFEDWTPEPEAFDLVLAATSIHHVANGVRYIKSALTLKPGGFIAILGNHSGADDPVFRAELDRLYAKWWGPELARMYAKQTLENRIGATQRQIEDSGKFGPVTIIQHPWSVEFDVPRYLALLDSDSGRLNHSPEAHEGMKKETADAINRLGGTVTRGYVAVLALAKRR